jgi:hypothetical protein
MYFFLKKIDIYIIYIYIEREREREREILRWGLPLHGLRINRPPTCVQLRTAANPQCTSNFTPLFPSRKKWETIWAHSAPYGVVTSHRSNVEF